METDITAELDYYPTSDGKPTAETRIHLLAMILLLEALEDFFRGRTDVFVHCDQFWYWEKGNRKAVIAPDLLVLTNTQPRDLRERACFFSWKEPKAAPAAVFEMASRKTWQGDVKEKYERYQSLGVREYFIFDPEAKYLDPQLQGFRLRGGKYQCMRGESLTSQLGFIVSAEGQALRLVDRRTNLPIPTREEAERQEKVRAKRESQELRKRVAAAEERVKTLEMEMEQFKELFHNRPGGNGK